MNVFFAIVNSLLIIYYPFLAARRSGGFPGFQPDFKGQFFSNCLYTKHAFVVILHNF